MHTGPSIIRDSSLDVVIDASSQRAAPDTNDTNLLDYSTWTVGGTSATGFSRNGGSTENIIEYNTGPFGEAAVIWAGRNNTTTSDSDGGWNGSLIAVDNSYLHRISVWVYRQVNGNGSFYLGTRGYNSAGTNEGVLTRSTNGNSTNPYFWSGGLSSADGWQLFVGHVWPANSGTGANHIDSGRYKISTGKFASISNDWVMKPTTTHIVHRTYLYYSTNTSTVQLWAYPRIDKIDGNEPSIEDLLNGGRRGIVNLAKPSQKFFLPNKLRRSDTTIINKPNIKKFTFDATDDFIQITGGTHTSYQRTVELIFRVNSVPATYTPIATYTRASGGVESGKRVWLGLQSGKFQMHGWGTNDPSSNTTVTNGNYFHCVYAYNQSTKYHYIWVNGVLERTLLNTEAGFTGWNNSSDLYWWVGRDPQAGNWTGGAGGYFDGDIAVFKTYNKVLSNSEVTRNYKAYKKRFELS